MWCVTIEVILWGDSGPAFFKPQFKGLNWPMSSFKIPYYTVDELFNSSLSLSLSQVPNTPGIATSLIRFLLFWLFDSASQDKPSYKSLQIWADLIKSPGALTMLPRPI